MVKTIRSIFYLTIGVFVFPVWSTELPGSGDFYAYHGWSVDVEDGIAVVGAPHDFVDLNGASVRAGAVYVYRLINGNWQQEQRLFADDLTPGDQFGDMTAIHQGRIFVGAPVHDLALGETRVEEAGAVYVYEESDGHWQMSQKLFNESAIMLENFGLNMAFGADRMFIAATENSLADEYERGVIHVYDLIAGTWQKTGTIRNDVAYENGGEFANWSMSYDDGLLATQVVVNTNRITSYIHLYEEGPTGWALVDVIESPNTIGSDFFGSKISLNGHRLLVSAAGETAVGNELNSGAAYLYEYVSDQWRLVKRFTAEEPTMSDHFGIDVVLSDDQLIIGQRHTRQQNALAGGVVYVYDLQGTDWNITRVISSGDAFVHDDFGQALGLDHDQLIVGAPYLNEQQGMAYTFAIEPNSERFMLNAGLNGNWYNPDTEGQGLFFDLRPEADYAYVGWFTFDTVAAEPNGAVGEATQRWLVGNGVISQSTQSITFDLFYAAGGMFDNNQAVVGPEISPYGSMTVVFDACDQGRVTYQIPSSGLSGSFAISRPANTGSGICAEYARNDLNTADGWFDVTLNGHWFNPETTGQGLFIDQFYGTDQAFLGWFTFDTSVPAMPVKTAVGAMGQRWLVGAGQVDAGDPAVLNFDLYYTAGGLFDDPQAVTVEGADGYGTLRLEFLDCANALASYELTTAGISGQFELVKLLTDADNPDCSATAFNP